MSRLPAILTTSSDFVPTASSASPADSGDGWKQWLSEAGQVRWQTAMKRAIRDSRELACRLELNADAASATSPSTTSPSTTSPSGDVLGEDVLAEQNFPTFVPLEYFKRIEPKNASDPLLRQVIASPQEDNVVVDGFVDDPVGDLGAAQAAGLLHKYHGRVLLLTTNACGVHCRYCFRRQFPYSDNRPQDYSEALTYLSKHPEIDEVILSGGDPLTIADEKLFELFDRIAKLGHIRRLRIHSRMPIVIPQRMTDDLIDKLRSLRSMGPSGKDGITTWMVVHANHANELDDQVIASFAKLVDAGVPVLNQAVLLRGVNDNVDDLAELCRKLADHRVMPYYLHQLDRVTGAAHFEVHNDRGRQLVEEIRKQLPGYAVPTYVTEQPGRESKSPL